MGLGTNHQTITSHDIFIPEVWQKRAQRAREARLHLASFVLRKDNEVEGFGDKINEQTISNLTATAKSASTAVTLSTPSESNVPLTVDKHYHVAFLVEDNLRVKSQLALQREYTTKGNYALGKQVDTDLFGLYSSLSENELGTAGSAITDDIVVSAWEAMEENDVPSEDRGWFFYPDAYGDLLKLDKFVRGDFKTNLFLDSDLPAALKKRVVGMLYGSPVFLTTNVPSATTGSPATTYHRNLYLHKEAFALALQQDVRTQTQYKLEYLGNLTVCDNMYGVAIERADHGIEIDR